MASHEFSFQYTPSSLRWDPLGSATPPPQRPGSVPFLWEEIPGKPKKEHTSIFKSFTDAPTDNKSSVSVRSLELPPRLVAKMKAVQRHVNLDSSAIVLDGPGLTKPGTTRVHVACHSFSYYREAKMKVKKQREAWFWQKKKKSVQSIKLGEELNITAPTLNRNRSFNGFSASHHSFRFWATIRENLKQVISWRKQGKTHHH